MICRDQRGRGVGREQRDGRGRRPGGVLGLIGLSGRRGRVGRVESLKYDVRNLDQYTASSGCIETWTNVEVEECPVGRDVVDGHQEESRRDERKRLDDLGRRRGLGLQVGSED